MYKWSMPCLPTAANRSGNAASHKLHGPGKTRCFFERSIQTLRFSCAPTTKTSRMAEIPTVNETAAFLFTEDVTPSFKTSCELKQILLQTKSQFQDIKVIETDPFGKTLVLDHKTQSAKLDEHIYHECLVHPAMLAHPNPKTVFIGGGGELATAREVLRHKSVEKVVMVDIDQIVVEFCRDNLKEWGEGAFDDPRLEVHYEDAKAFLENHTDTYDVIIMDIADPIEAGPGIALYTRDFYEETVLKRLNSDGVFVTQSGPFGVLCYTECFTVINKTLASAFDTVVPYSAEIPSFGTPWGFNIAYNKSAIDQQSNQTVCSRPDIRNCSPKLIDELTQKRIKNFDSDLLHFYDGICHRGIFGVPKHIRKALIKENRVMTMANPG
eukprot:437343_1